MFDVFRNVLEEIRREISEASYNTWFKNVDLVELDTTNRVARVGVPNVFAVKQFEVKYAGLFIKAFRNNNIELDRVDFTVKNSGKTRVRAREVKSDEGLRLGGDGQSTSISEALSERMKDTPVVSRNSTTGLNSKFTLDNFIVGSSNDLAAGVAKRIVEQPGGKYYKRPQKSLA